MNFTKLFIITNMPSPYQVEFFNVLSARTPLEVIYARKTLRNRKWNFGKYIKHTHHFLSGNINSRLSAIKKIVLKEGPDALVIISGYNLPEFLYSMKIVSRHHIPWVFWGEKIRLNHLALKKLTALGLVKKANAILAIGEQAASIYYELLKKPTYVFPYHINTAKFKEPEYFYRDKINFVYSGQMIERKGIHVIKEALIKLNRQYLEKVFIHFIGDGPLLVSLKESFSNFENVRFYGFVKYEDLPGLYEMGDVFLFPSLYDGWGVALLEGMAAGMLPVSTFSSGAAVQCILNGENGFIIPPDNPSEITRIIEYLINTPDIIPTMGRKAREYAIKNNDVEKGTNDLLSILNSL